MGPWVPGSVGPWVRGSLGPWVAGFLIHSRGPTMQPPTDPGTDGPMDPRTQGPAFVNPAVERTAAFRGLFTGDEYNDVRGFFSAHPELTPTPLTPLPSIATAAGIGAAGAKDESRRFGLNAFKIAGVRYAMHKLQDAVTPGGVVCATAGNHGRAVARAARERGVACTVFIPAAVSPTASEQQVRSQRIRAMREDGADV